jgi:hypothetical protein
MVLDPSYSSGHGATTPPMLSRRRRKSEDFFQVSPNQFLFAVIPDRSPRRGVGEGEGLALEIEEQADEEECRQVGDRAGDDTAGVFDSCGEKMIQ